MFDFGIAGYRPRWLTGLAAIRAEHGDRLAALVGRRLTRTRVVWERGDDEWFADAPVLLDFDGEQVELNHQKFDELSITWNSVDPTRGVRWPVPGFDLGWRDDVPVALADLTGGVLGGVDLLITHDGEVVDVGFDFGESGYLTVGNALDENGLDFTAPDPRRRHPPR